MSINAAATTSLTHNRVAQALAPVPLSINLLRASWTPSAVTHALTQLLLDGNYSERDMATAALALPDNLPDNLVALLAGHANAFLRLAACRQRNLATYLTDSLLADKLWEIRAARLSNHAPLPAERIAHIYTTDADPSVRAAALRHPDIPAELIYRASTADLPARRAAAGNPTLSAELLHELALDQASTVRAAAAAHHTTPIEDLHRLAYDPDPAVRAAAAGNQKLPGLAAQHLSSAEEPLNVRSMLARHRDLPDAVAKALLVDTSPLIRRITARNQDGLTAATIQQAITGEHDIRVLAALLQHPHAPESIILRSLSNTRGSLLPRSVAHRQDELSAAVAQQLAVNDDLTTLVALTRRTDCPLPFYASAVDHPLAVLRLAAVLNPAAPAGVIDQATTDPEPLTAFTARVLRDQ